MNKRQYPFEPKGFVVMHCANTLCSHDGKIYPAGILTPPPGVAREFRRRCDASRAVSRTARLFREIGRNLPDWKYSQPTLGEAALYQIVPVWDRGELFGWLNNFRARRKKARADK